MMKQARHFDYPNHKKYLCENQKDDFGYDLSKLNIKNPFTSFWLN